MMSFQKLAIVVFSLVASCAAAAGDRTLEHEAVIDAPVADVWAAFTTKEGIESWMVAIGEIDFRIGGDMRTSYDPISNLHDDKTIVNRILSYEPERMLSFQNIDAPAGVPFDPALFQQTWSVMYFEPVGEHRTRVRLVGIGYGEGEDWDAAYSFFERNNPIVLDALRRRFPQRSATNDAEAVMADLRSLTGKWIHEHMEDDGSIFRSRSEVGLGPDGKSIVSRGFLMRAEGMTWHAATQIIHDPLTDEVRYQDINESGWIARGRIERESDGTLLWHWNAHDPQGAEHAYRVRTNIESDDGWRFRLFVPSEGATWTEVVNILYERVEEIPDRFLTAAEKSARAMQSH